MAAKRKARATKWFEAKEKELNPPADEVTSESQADADKGSAAPSKDAAASATATDAAETAPMTGSADKAEAASAAQAGDASAAPADPPADKADAAVSLTETATAESGAAGQAPVPMMGEGPKSSAEAETTREQDSKPEDQVAGDGDISMAEA